jgi:uncharacterized delta-60 repeat protein
VSTDLPGRSDVANGVALHADGRIVLAGQGDGPAFVGVALVQYNSDGSLDMTFGTGGIVLSDVFGAANAVAVQPDGRVIVAGLSFAVARFNADGTLDPGFGSGGLVTVPFGAPGTSEALALLVQPDGQIVVGGVSFAGHGAFALARLNADGSLDKRFGHGGMVTTDFGGGTGGIRALVLQPDGGLVAAGGGVPSHSGVAPDFALVRYESNGNLDRSFGMNGLATVDVDNLGASDFVLALAAQPDGRLVAVGGVQQTCEVDGCDRGGFGLARFLP